MKVPLKRHPNLFSKLRRRLLSVKWPLLLITTAMFFLSASQGSCGSWTIQMVPGPAVDVQQPNPLAAPPPASSPTLPPLTQVQVPTIPPLVGVGSPGVVLSVGSPTVDALGLSPIAAPNKKQADSTTNGGKIVKVVIKKGTPTNADPSVCAFVPLKVNIKKGDTVVWSNSTADNQTLVDAKGKLNSGNIGQGKTFKQQFNQSGLTVDYNCKGHKEQIGTITVK